jgi:hypothetical protein
MNGAAIAACGLIVDAMPNNTPVTAARQCNLTRLVIVANANTMNTNTKKSLCMCMDLCIKKYMEPNMHVAAIAMRGLIFRSAKKLAVQKVPKINMWVML